MSDPGPNADPRFVGYYANTSESASTHDRFEGTRRVTLAMRGRLGLPIEALDVVDVGCGAGTQTMLWARHGHHARGVDISAPLIEIAGQRAAEASLSASFSVGSAAGLPLASASADIVLISELLEHVTDWEPCVNEAVRLLRPGGVLYISTTNWLCPSQDEFNLPAYSWYPGFVKRRCEKMAVTTHGHWVQFASFPAVHWFSFFQLRKYLDARGVSAQDRFDFIDASQSIAKRIVVALIKALPPLRWLAHGTTSYTLVVGYRRPT